METEQRKFPKPHRELVFYQSRRNLNDSVVISDGKVYWYQNDGPNGTPLVSFNVEDYDEVNRLRLHSDESGKFPWDHWKILAIADGVREDLAQLGRNLIREADQHSWSVDLQTECGWFDHGKSMIHSHYPHQIKPVIVGGTCLKPMVIQSRN